MIWLTSAGVMTVGAVLMLVGRRGNQRRLSGLDESGDLEVSLVDRWTIKQTSGDSGVYWTFWWSVKRPGFAKTEKVKVTESTYESLHPPALVTLHVHPQTGRLFDEKLGQRVRLGFESLGWAVIALGVGLVLFGATGHPVWVILAPLAALGVLAYMRKRADLEFPPWAGHRDNGR